MKLQRKRLVRRKRGVWPDYHSEWDAERGMAVASGRKERRFQRRTARTRAAAYHEAAHIVGHIIEYEPDEVFGARIGMIANSWDRRGGGTTYNNLGSINITTHHRLQELVCSMMGVIAESYATSQHSDDLIYGAKGDHDYQGRLYASQRNMKASMLYFERAYLRADGIVRRHWPMIRRIAERLYRDGAVGINRPLNLSWTRPLVGSKVAHG